MLAYYLRHFMRTQGYHPYIEKNKDRFLSELFEFLRIPSISADSKYIADVKQAAEWVANSLREVAVENVEVIPTKGHPIVYGEKITGLGKPTVLVYGHYDVQPPDPVDLWETPPFEPTVRKEAKSNIEKIYARGACDDKGQAYMHVKALEMLLQEGELPVNLKFMIEGEEEIGSENLGAFLEANKERLKADVILISDTGILSNENPSITTGLRGLAYMFVDVIGPDKDLHSGMYGGAVANPINVLCNMIASLHDEKRRVTIPGFYDRVRELSNEERTAMGKAPFSEQEFMESLDIAAVQGEEGYTTLERKSIRPTLDVNGIWGGYTGEGAKTVIASEAHAKISMRLVPDQNPDQIAELFKTHLEDIAPKSVKVKVTSHHNGWPSVTPTDSNAYKAAEKAFEQAWGKTPIPMREGGSIPIVALFEKVLGLKSVLLGFGLDSDTIHSPNESYGVFNFLKGIETIAQFHKNFGEMGK